MTKAQTNPSDKIGYSLRDGTIREDIAWISRFDPDKCLLKGDNYLRAKRLFDLVLTLLSMPFWGTLILVTMFVVKHEYPSRKVFYKQLRTGQGGTRFWMYKFQTMVPNAEELKPTLMHLNVLEWPDFKVPDDPRVTKVGKILRKTSIDELPQLWNVLKGQMSLVGPRPTSFSPDTYKVWQTERLDVPPGMTGLWQITHRGETEFKERLLIDIAYIQHQCMRLDIEILVRTVTSIFKGKGIT
jgi:lipopolysaccharide/colanic/teichoic acid biosynthesis glycosyltransferase